jgi:TRAP-type C4-dicarboxylate transport system permease small subunit
MKTVSNYLEKTFGYIDKALKGFLMFLMAAIVVVVTWQVITRFLMTQPSSYTEELARFFLIWIAILGSAYAFRTGAHLGLDLLTEKLEGAIKRRTAIVANLVCFVFAASVMVYGGLKLMMLTLELNQTSSSLGIKMGYVYTVVPLSGALICLYALKNMFNPNPQEVAAPDTAPLDLDR